MANTFAITTTTENFIADVNGTAKASIIFTVTNTTDGPVRGIARIQALEKTQDAWLSLDGEPEKEFPVGSTQQFVVKFEKPLEQLAEGKVEPEEKYPYRLSVASAVRPDEDFDEGPKVTIIKPERKGVAKKRGIPWWVFLIIGIVVLIAIVVGLIFGLRNCGGKGSKPVPDVSTKPTTVEVARKTLEDEGFLVEVKPVSAPNRHVDFVLDQTPKGGEEAKVGSTVNITEPDKTKVPVLKGKCLTDVMTAFFNENLKIGESVGDDADIIACTSVVASTRPAEETPIAKGSTVNVNFTCVPKPNKLCGRIAPDKLVDEFRVKGNPSDTKRLVNVMEGITH
jgi:hypothetical protein